MKAALFGMAALVVSGVTFAAPASALPITGGIASEPLVEKTVVVSRTVKQGPRCRTVVTRKVGPMGGRRVVKRKTCA